MYKFWNRSSKKGFRRLSPHFFLDWLYRGIFLLFYKIISFIRINKKDHFCKSLKLTSFRQHRSLRNLFSYRYLRFSESVRKVCFGSALMDVLLNPRAVGWALGILYAVKSIQNLWQNVWLYRVQIYPYYPQFFTSFIANYF